jgi:tRNA threonylcarbamoyl adenosine modification protein YeaZ/ribosomal-protein-alanine acetyltransferase
MTLILSIDTSTDRTCVAIVETGINLEGEEREYQEVFHLYHDDPLAHGEVLPKLVAQGLDVLKEKNINKGIEAVAVGMGPGPFTGLRTGIAFAQAFAFAREIKCIGVCSHDAIALRTSFDDFIVATDARRKEVFYSRYIDGKADQLPRAAHPSQLVELDIPIIGEGALKYGLTTDDSILYPDAVALAILAEGAYSRGESIGKPLYVRKPDAYPAPSGITFRAMNAMDIIPVYDIEKRSYFIQPWSLNQFKEELGGPGRHYLVAVHESQIVGYIGAWHNDDVVDILTLTVDPDFRRKGIARELLKRIIDWARNKKAIAMMLDMREGNVEAQGLYLDYGFVAISHRKDYYATGVSAVIMRKELR